jgi:hypothetical protein
MTASEPIPLLVCGISCGELCELGHDWAASHGATHRACKQATPHGNATVCATHTCSGVPVEGSNASTVSHRPLFFVEPAKQVRGAPSLLRLVRWVERRLDCIVGGELSAVRRREVSWPTGNFEVCVVPAPRSTNVTFICMWTLYVNIILCTGIYVAYILYGAGA